MKIIFNPRLFNTSEKVTELKQTIGSFISENPTKDEMKVDAKKMNQFFCQYMRPYGADRMYWPMRVWRIWAIMEISNVSSELYHFSFLSM